MITRAIHCLTHITLYRTGVCQMHGMPNVYTVCLFVFYSSLKFRTYSSIHNFSCTSHTHAHMFILSNIESIYSGLSYRTNMFCCIVSIGKLISLFIVGIEASSQAPTVIHRQRIESLLFRITFEKLKLSWKDPLVREQSKIGVHSRASTFCWLKHM